MVCFFLVWDTPYAPKFFTYLKAQQSNTTKQPCGSVHFQHLFGNVRHLVVSNIEMSKSFIQSNLLN